MFGHKFYHSLTRKYISIFGTIFNDISIVSEDGNEIKVPINFGPIEKFYARLKQDPIGRPISLTLPRIAFNMTGMSYDSDRKLLHQQTNLRGITDPVNRQKIWTPVPYSLDFELTIIAKYLQDGEKILEQILPFFKPNFTVAAKLMENYDDITDIPIVLNSIMAEDSFEGSFEEGRILTWNLTFSMKALYWGPESKKKIIKFVGVNVSSPGSTANMTIRPGLTSDGKPTKDPDNSINWLEINIDDNWDYITEIDYVDQ